MRIPRQKAAQAAIRLGARAAAATATYVAAALAVLLTVILLRGIVAPAALKNVLGFIFIATLASGLEPGTIKAAALGKGGVSGSSVRAYLIAGSVKALCASPFMALLWRVSDPSLSPWVLLWTPLVVIAGFCTTDLRVLLDLTGRHSLAIGLKQGSLAGGVVLMGLLLAAGVPLFWAVGVSTLARLAPLLAGLAREGQGRDRLAGSGSVWRLLTDRRWVELAAVSLIGAGSGSADRVFGLRLLSPADYGGYYLTYELFTKFWLISYIFGPILFARQASGDRSHGFVRGAWVLTGALGAAFIVVVAGLLAFAPGLLIHYAGASFGVSTLAFAAAVVVGAFSQLRVAQLQGAGRARQAATAMGVCALVSIPVFYLAATNFGVRGLLLAFLTKTGLELAALSWVSRSLPRSV